jgi:hypothetical protein
MTARELGEGTAILALGDFNDEPSDESLDHRGAPQRLHGTIDHDGNSYVDDQILVARRLLIADSRLRVRAGRARSGTACPGGIPSSISTPTISATISPCTWSSRRRPARHRGIRHPSLSRS